MFNSRPNKLARTTFTDDGEIYRYEQDNALHRAIINIILFDNLRAWKEFERAIEISTKSTISNSNIRGYNCLHDAIRLPHVYACPRLGEQDQHIEKRHVVSLEIFSALITSIQDNFPPEIFIPLLTAFDKNKKNVLHYIFSLGTPELLNVFLVTLHDARHNQTLTERNYNAFITHRIDSGFTFLIYAVNTNSCTMLKLFLNELEDALATGKLDPASLVNIVRANTMKGWNLMHYAAEKGNFKLVKLLWEWLEKLFARTNPDILHELLAPSDKTFMTIPECAIVFKESYAINEYLANRRNIFNITQSHANAELRSPHKKRALSTDADAPEPRKKGTLFNQTVEPTAENLLLFCIKSNPLWVERIIATNPKLMFVKLSIIINNDEVQISPLQWALRVYDRRIISLFEKYSESYELLFLMQADETLYLDPESILSAYQEYHNLWSRYQIGNDVTVADVEYAWVHIVGKTQRDFAPQHLLRVLCASEAYCRLYWRTDSNFPVDPENFGDKFGLVEYQNQMIKNYNNYYKFLGKELGVDFTYSRDDNFALCIDVNYHNGQDAEIIRKYFQICEFDMLRTLDRMKQRTVEKMLLAHEKPAPGLRRRNSYE